MKRNECTASAVCTRPGVPSHVRALIMVGVLLVLIAGLSVYNYYNLRNSMDIETVDTLSGQRIACCAGWESDYLLTPRSDVTLLRYDTNADCILGLSYGQVDAVALDELTMHTIFAKTEGLERLDDPITSVGATFYASYAAEDKLAQFNEFAAAFVQSGDYQPYHDALYTDDYHMAEIPAITDGEPLVVGYVPDSYPESYIDFVTGEPTGYGIEMVQRFAYEYGYTIEWVETSETSALVELGLNRIDFAACYVSDISRDDTENSGQAHMTAPYLFIDVYLMKIKDGAELTITGEIEY